MNLSSLFALALILLHPEVVAAPQSPPIVAGLGRAGLSAIDRGLVLIDELGCANCHGADSEASSNHSKLGPDLAELGSRVLHPYLRKFLADPRSHKPGTTMPDLMGALTTAERAKAAEDLTHFLLASAEQVAPSPIDGLAIGRGQQVFHEVGCVACHAPRDAEGREKADTAGQSVPLGVLTSKYSVTSLMEFLTDPQHVRVSGRMPNLNLAPQELYDLSHYLMQGMRVAGGLNVLWSVDGKPQGQGIMDSFNPPPWSDRHKGFAVDYSGFLNIKTAGSYGFELRSNGVGVLTVGGKAVASLESGGVGKSSIQLPVGRVAVALRYEPSQGEKDLSVRWSGPGFDAQDLSYPALQASEDRVPRFESLRIDSSKAASGKSLYTKLGCVACHTRAAQPAAKQVKHLRECDGHSGCMSESRGAWPYFELAASQGLDLRAALAALDQESSPERQIRRTLASFNCIACHQRGDFGGVTESRNEFFTTHDQNLGEAGRLPPPLTGVGAKLQATWSSKSIAYGQSIRGYMLTRMPGFGQAVGARLSRLFDVTDSLPAAPIEALPKPRKLAEEVRKIGHQLTGNKGMNCIACHSFGGRGSAAMAAVDLVASTGKRLKPDWFYHYMRNPVRFRPGTLMPQFFVGGTSTRPDIAEGNVDKQLTGLWHYLAAGRNSRAPSGMQRPSMEIKVGTETVILRRKVQNTGKRGISVGYPGGINLTFDAESLAVNQLWWGRFVDAGGVWSGQGSGAARIMERQRVDLGKGPAFAMLSKADDLWPKKTRRELGYEFEGYDLDALQRPSFRYRVHGVAIRDSSMVMMGEPKTRPILRRTLTLHAEKDTRLFFRAVAAAPLQDLGQSRVRVGKHVLLHLPPDSYRIRSAAKGQELIVAIPIRSGRGSLVIDYSFVEGQK